MSCTQEDIDFVKARQAQMPPHLAGFPHNASPEEVDRVVGEVRKASGMDVGPRDFWVNVSDGVTPRALGPFSAPSHAEPPNPEGTLSFGYVTRHGEEAVSVVRDIREGREAEWECFCGCHTHRAMMHCFPCCAGPCRHCHRFFHRGRREAHEARCPSKPAEAADGR